MTEQEGETKITSIDSRHYLAVLVKAYINPEVCFGLASRTVSVCHWLEERVQAEDSTGDVT